MGDLESLLLVLSAIYLSDCAVWIRRGGVAVLTAWGKSWRLRHPGAVLGNGRGALLFANPLPPFGTVLIAHQFPVSLSTTGVLSFTSASINPDWRPAQQERWFAFSEIQSIAVEGRAIEINNEPFLKAPSPVSARWIAGTMQKLRGLPKAERVDAIWAAMEGMFATEALRTRWQAFQGASKWLRILGHILFVYLFLVAPALLWLFGLRAAGLPIVVGLLFHTVTIAWLFRGAHQKLFPDGAAERFVPFLTMLLAPPTAIRSRDLLSRHLVEQFHPLALAQVFCSRTELESLARHVLRDLSFPILPAGPSSSDRNALQTEDSFRALMFDCVKTFLTGSGLKPDELLRPPQRLEPEHLAYCPRCHEPFIAHPAACSQCGGRAAVPFG